MSKKNVHPINLPEDIIEDIKSNKLVVAEVIRNALNLTKLEPKYLYEVSYTRENIRFYCIVDKPKDSKVMQQIHWYAPYLSKKLAVVGVGEIDIRLIGAFPKMLDAMKVSEIYINCSLDAGYNVLNKDFTRLIHFMVDSFDRIKTVLPTQAHLGILLTEVLKILHIIQFYTKRESYK